MVRAIGVDPGTKSFDICGIENGRVYYECSIDTIDVMENPQLLLSSIEKAMPCKLIAGPSGYGVPLTYLKEIPEDKLEEWYLTHILLLREDIKKATERGDIGMMVYSAMTKTAVEMKKRGWPVCYIPGVVHLPSVPEYRKINKLDMGTADKMCIAILGVHDQATEYGIEYDEVSFILVEMGFGYNAVIGVEQGKIVDGIGGTLGGMGFITLGGVDAELVQLVGVWEKSDIFHGGAYEISGKKTPEELIENLDDEKCEIAWNALFEGVIKDVYSMLASVGNPREILISGRMTRIKYVEEQLIDRLSKVAEVRRIGSIEGAKNIKEAAQGYAMVAEGLAGGCFRELVEWIGIPQSKHGIIEYVVHPKIESVKRLFDRSY